MPLPTEVRIQGHTVRIERFPRDGRNRVGECEHDLNVIRIGDWLEESVAQATLLHEVVHFLSDALGLELSEEQVGGLGQGLYQVLVENRENKKNKSPKVTDWDWLLYRNV